MFIYCLWFGFLIFAFVWLVVYFIMFCVSVVVLLLLFFVFFNKSIQKVFVLYLLAFCSSPRSPIFFLFVKYLWIFFLVPFLFSFTSFHFIFHTIRLNKVFSFLYDVFLLIFKILDYFYSSGFGACFFFFFFFNISRIVNIQL